MTTLDLNGSWLIRHDPFNAGLLWGWASQPPEHGWREIAVPSAWQSVLGMEANGVAWYQRLIPDEVLGWLKDPRAHARLRFESVATDCRAWVNGVEVGRHVGDYVPFEFDITEALRGGDGSRKLIVRVDQVHAPRPVKGTVTENGHITKGFHDVLSAQHAGIWGGVTVRTSGAGTVKIGGLSALADPASGFVQLRVEFDGETAGHIMPFHIEDPDGEMCGGGSVVLAPGMAAWEGTIGIGAGGDFSIWDAEDDDPFVDNLGDVATDTDKRTQLQTKKPIRRWSAEEPNLYTLHLDLVSGKGQEQTIEVHTFRFGFRTIATGGPDNSLILLNGRPICLRGILHWGHEPAHIAPAPPPEQVREEFTRLRALGFNCVCLCLVYMPEYFYDIADETGMLIWQEHPVWKSPMGDEHIPEYRRMFDAFFRRDRRHASVILVSGSCEHEAFNKTLAKWWWQRAREMLPDRLLQVQTAFFNWTDPDQTDLYDEHVYDNSGRWVKFLDDVQSKIKELKPKPFIMGETIISNAWPDVEAYRARLGADHPWWTTRGLKECAEFESWISNRYGLATLARFRRQADRFGKQYRKFQAEMFRMSPNHAGWVMNHIRDVPACRCGFMDDFDTWRWTPEETRSWLGESPVLLWAPDHRRGFVGGRDLPVRVGVSNFSAKAVDRKLIVGTGVGAEPSVTPCARTGNLIDTECGSVGSLDAVLKLPAAATPTRLPVHASVDGGGDNSWDLWVFPEPRPLPAAIVCMTGLPFTAAERKPEFEEKAYSAGWGLPCRSWTPSLPDTALLFRDTAVWEHGSPIPRDARVIVTHRLTSQVAEHVRSGGRAILLASRHAGGFGSKFVNLYGQVPLVIERETDSWPVGPGDSDWIVDLLHYDLSLNSARAVPMQELGIDGIVDPIIRLVFTHDSGVPKPFDAVFAARVGTGLLVVTCLDHSIDAGRYLLARLLAYAAGAKSLPAAELDVSRWTT